MVQLTDFHELIAKDGHRHLLLGNGFSISCNKIFSYDSLYERTAFQGVSEFVEIAFETLKTHDFEKVMNVLNTSSKVLQIYKGDKKLSEQLEADAEALKKILVESIANCHLNDPTEIGEESYSKCITFLKYFRNIYYLNYDLLLYWALMHAEGRISCDDGFRKAKGTEEYVTWSVSANKQNIYYLHGALHLFDSPTELKKYTWVNKQVPLMVQIRQALDSGFFPLFISEGTSEEKFSRILHNGYLTRGLRSLPSIGGSLFVFGHSFADNDDHIINIIPETKIQTLCVSLYGDPNSDGNKLIIKKVEKLKQMRGNEKPMSVYFFDTETAEVW